MLCLRNLGSGWYDLENVVVVWDSCQNVNKQLISRKKIIQNCLYKKKFFYAPCSHNYLDDVFEAAVGDCFQINTSLGKILNNVDVTRNKQLIIIISCVNKQLPWFMSLIYTYSRSIWHSNGQGFLMRRSWFPRFKFRGHSRFLISRSLPVLCHLLVFFNFLFKQLRNNF